MFVTHMGHVVAVSDIALEYHGIMSITRGCQVSVTYRSVLFSAGKDCSNLQITLST